jgi:trimeric autotransporter adhesin
MHKFALEMSEKFTTVTKRLAGARVSCALNIAIFLLALLVAPQTLWGQAKTTAHPSARVQQRVDNTKRATLGGHVLPALRGATDLGRLSGSTAMNHMVMVLQASPEQGHALQSLLDQQLDSGHANFHKWMTPDEFGTHFGVDDADIAQVTGWLGQQGFLVEKVSPSKRFIQFSGKVGQVEFAFKTEMHRYNVNGKVHVANSTDISVPAALKPVISGVPTLHDFFKKSNMADAATITADPSTGKMYLADPYKGTPDYTSGTTHFVGAGDFATIYNTNPLLTAGNDGTGVSIGIIGRTDINLSDVQIYRTFFKLKDNDPTFVVAGEDPGFVGGDDGESYLDVEVSGGAAPGAAVKFITSRATLTTDGVDLAAMYAVQNNLTDVISESYGQCEADFSAAQASFYSSLWAQAAAQGQSVFVSSGDNGPASCENSNNTFETTGYAVSLLASSPYNVAVGGTLFADTAANWGTTATTTPPFSSALGYIAEVPWNEAKASGSVGAGGLWSGSGGISSYFMTPSWQHGFGVPTSDPAYAGTGFVVDPATPFVSGPHRYLPDVSMAAAAQHDGTLYCAEGICQLSSTNTIVNAGIVGGTSVAAPTMAGVQALIDQYNGGRQGQPNYVYYALADAQHTASLNCAANAGASLNSQCAFHDVTTGNNLICADTNCTAAKKIGWTAAAGYDLATGLGSPNATNLAHLWSTVTFRSTTTSMGLSQTTGIAHGQAVTVSGTVAPGSGTGTATGTVAFIASSGALSDPVNSDTGAFLNPVSIATLDGSGHYSISVANLPAGTYFLTARYGGDKTFASSLSTPIQVTVAAETSGVTIQPNAFNGTTCIETPATTFTYGSYIWTDFTVTGASGQGVPTGTVAITDNGNALLTSSLNPSGLAHTLSGAIPSTSCVLGYTFQDTAPPTGGTHVIGATYSGDSTFHSMTATPVTVTITPATITGTIATSATTINSGATVQLSFTLAGLSGAGAGTLSPTGTVTFTDTTTSAVLGTATLSPTSTFGGLAVLSTTALTHSGANSITASWPGDSNYSAVSAPTAPVSVTVNAGTATSVAVTSSANPAAVGGRPTFTATMTPTTVTSGTVNFFDGTVLLGTGTVGTAHTATFRPAASANLPAGVHSITAAYAGTSTFNSSVSPVFSQTFTKASTTVSLTVKSAGTYGDSFGLSAIVGVSASAAPVPSGTVTFFDGGTQIGSPVPMAIITSANGGEGLYDAVSQQSLGAGTHTITAQLSDSNYTASTSNSQTITVSKATATIALTNTVQTYTGSPLAVTATTTPAALSTVTIAYTGTGGTTYGPSTTPPTNVGTYAVSATLNNANYTGSQSGTLTITKANQTITFTGLPATVNSGAPLPFTLTGTASSGLPVSYTFTGPATLSGSTLTINGNATGSVVVTASQAGNANYNAAAPVSQTIVIGTVVLTSSAVLSKISGGYQAVVTVVNSGTGSASNVMLTVATLGTANGSVIPASFGTIAHGASASVTVTFPTSAGVSGAGVVEKLTGTFTGGTFGGSSRVVLPN